MHNPIDLTNFILANLFNRPFEVHTHDCNLKKPTSILKILLLLYMVASPGANIFFEVADINILKRWG